MDSQIPDITKAKILAAKIRRSVVRIIGCDGHVGHLGGSCSSADVVAALYGVKMRLDPNDPKWSARDKFIYSKGHAAVAQYAAMAEIGYFPPEELLTTKILGSRLQGHPDRLRTPGVEAGTGSLGQGLSIANGMALAMRLNKSDSRVYCVIGDGELNEGQIWEAAMAAAHYKISNVTAIVDHNKLQAMAPCEESMTIEPVADKWRAFGWNAVEIDGHDMEDIFHGLDAAKACEGGPTVLVAHTVKGKGFPFAENVVAYHNAALTPELYREALEIIEAELESLGRCAG